MDSAPFHVPKFTLKRLPYYYRFVRHCADQGISYVSSEEIAKAAQVNAVQVRKDLALFRALGTPGVGYRVAELQYKLEDILGLKNVNEAVLIGLGQLGRAIASYSGFQRYGLNIVALFDSDPALIGKSISGREVFSIDKLPHILDRLRIKVGIITAPAEAAQSIADILVDSGIRAIWNFAPVSLNLPPAVVVRNEDLAAGLATLFHYLAEEEDVLVKLQ